MLIHPRHCALIAGHDGPCIDALELTKRIEQHTTQLMRELLPAAA